MKRSPTTAHAPGLLSRRSRRVGLAVLIALILPALASAQSLGPAPVLLGAAGNYTVLAKTGISAVPNSPITGNLGVSPAAASSITGFSMTLATGYATAPQVTGRIYAADMADPTPANLTTAISNMEAAYTDAAGRPGPDFTELYSGNIGGQTLTPGLYKWSSGVLAPTSFSLNGGPNDVWILQIAGTLTVGSDVNVTLSGGARPENVFWQVAGAVTIGTNAHFEGIILGKTEIVLQQGASINGRTLSQTAVTLDMNTVTQPAVRSLMAGEGDAWHMLAAPAAGRSIGDVVGSLWTQGYPGADYAGGGANVFLYDEAAPGAKEAGYVAADSQGAAWASGTGRFVYVYEDDDMNTAGIQGGFPKEFAIGGPVVMPSFTFALSYTDDATAPASADGWNMLGNPFATAMDWDAVVIGPGLDASVYAYDPTYLGGSYRSYAGGVGALTDGIVAPMQGFWVHTTAPGASLVAPSASQTTGGILYRGGTASASTGALRFELREGGVTGAETFVSASPDGTLAVDAYDAYALDPPRASFLRLATEPITESARLSIQSVPDGLSGQTTLPLAAEVVGGTTGARLLELAWDATTLPAGWMARLVDTETGESRGLATAGTYSFETVARAAQVTGSPMATVARSGPARFQIVLASAVVATEPGAVDALALTVTPNPVAGRGNVRISVPTGGLVRMALYDVLGREVAVLMDGVQTAGTQSVALDAGRLAPGVYVVRLVAGAETVMGRVTVTR